MTKSEIETSIAAYIEKYGQWAYDIPLPHGIWTRGNLGIPHTRLKRLVQIASDLSLKPISESTVLDLGCLDGLFSLEFALHGARVTGIEIRESNVKKAELVNEILGHSNLNFICDDVRNVSVSKNGTFDIVICSGMLYHLTTPDVFQLIENMHSVANRMVIIDTHISLKPSSKVKYNGKEYDGHFITEHAENDSSDVKNKRYLASIDNNQSFLFTRPSLMNFLETVGFSSVYECFNPSHLNFGEPGLECRDRCTFVAIKAEKTKIHTSPLANTLREDWPKDSLDYSYKIKQKRLTFLGRIRRLIGILVGSHN
jgi:2-polyprenyl-3-methyl-5-hydroxy-6-metoxy-1,4-benzoquinol methylase